MMSDEEVRKLVMHVRDNVDYPQDGWYFSDECQLLQGPYETEAEAIAACKAYEP
jgi:hypothetical protein